ncbi:MAG: hypothetical protein EOO38_31075 [Cytophagaceae bacterium]|nr:MAG: hypothetical protein EOO38_31075 [Cytophagaceae bacterium]
MSFSYERSLEPWKPMVDKGDAKIRVLELHPLPWYLRWVPRAWEVYIPLRASLAWAPLAELNVSKRKTTITDVDDAMPTGDTASPAKTDSTSVVSSTPSAENSRDQMKLGSRQPKYYPPYKGTITSRHSAYCQRANTRVKHFHTLGVMAKRKVT